MRRRMIPRMLVALAAMSVAAVAVAPVSSAHGIWLQQYARKAADTCADGWSASWATWPNGSTGGFVCTREVDDPSVPDAGPRYSRRLAGTFTLGAGPNELAFDCRPFVGSTERPAASVASVDPASSGVTYTESNNVFTFSSPTANNTVQIWMLCPENYQLVMLV